jgi:hypothetical protein
MLVRHGIAVGALLAFLLGAPTGTAGAADEAKPAPLTLCLDTAADGSPVFPLTEVPANYRELFVAYHLRDDENPKALTHAWTAVDVGKTAPSGTVIDKGTLELHGLKQGGLRLTLPRDFPVGKYRVDVQADGKPWASLDITVVPPKPAVALAKPEDLLPLAVGTKWTDDLTVEVGAIVKHFSLSGAQQGADGKWHSLATYTVVGTDDTGAHVEIRRNDVLVNEEWWKLDAHGLAVTHERQGDASAAYDPPVPMVRLPLEPGKWKYTAKDKSFERAYRVWGPLSVRGPKGPVPGYVVLSSFQGNGGPMTIEREVAPGIGIVREVQVSTFTGKLTTRLEATIVSAP